MESRAKRTACVLAIVGMLASTVFAEDKKKELGWFDTAELSFVATSGNSEATALGFNNVLRRVWESSRFRVEVGGIRSESRDGDRFAVGDTTTFSVKEPPKSINAERYFLKSIYTQDISPRFTWNAGLDAEQNEPSGIDSRVTVFAGLGNTWVDREDVKFSTVYSASWTNEEFVVGDSNDFAGLRLAYLYQNVLTDSTTFDSELTADENLDDTDDWRVDFFNAVTVSINKRVALKAGLRMVYRNMPPLEEITVFDVNPRQDPAAVALGTVTVEKDELDTTFSTSLVINF